MHVFLFKRGLSGRKLLFFQLGLGSQLFVLGILRLATEIDDTGFLILVGVDCASFQRAAMELVSRQSGIGSLLLGGGWRAALETRPFEATIPGLRAAWWRSLRAQSARRKRRLTRQARDCKPCCF